MYKENAQQEPEQEVERSKDPVQPPKNLFGFNLGYQVRNYLRKLDPTDDNVEHFNTTHQTLYSSRIMAKAVPDFIFSVVSIDPEIASPLAKSGRGGKERIGTAEMMQSFFLANHSDENISRKEAARLGRIHNYIPVKDKSEKMAFVRDVMILAEREMLRVVGAPEMEGHFQAATTERWTTLVEQMATHMDIDFDNGRGRSTQDIEAAVRKHIQEHGKFSKDGQTVAMNNVEDFKSNFPKPLQGVAEQFFLSMFDESIRELLGLKKPRPRAQKLAQRVIKDYIGTKPLHLVREVPWGVLPKEAKKLK